MENHCAEIKVRVKEIAKIHQEQRSKTILSGTSDY